MRRFSRRVTGIARRCVATAATPATGAVSSELTPNPYCLVLRTSERELLPAGKALDIPTHHGAFRSPLAQRLFDVDGNVQAVYICGHHVTVTRKKPAAPSAFETFAAGADQDRQLERHHVVRDAASDAAWDPLKDKLTATFAAFMDSGRHPLSLAGVAALEDVIDDTAIDLEADDEPTRAVKELIATELRPMVQMDGGNLRFIGMDPCGTVFIQFEGACVSCPSSGVTLKDGIERTLVHWVPEVSSVVEVGNAFAREYRRDAAAMREHLKAAKLRAAQEEAAAPATTAAAADAA